MAWRSGCAYAGLALVLAASPALAAAPAAPADAAVDELTVTGSKQLYDKLVRSFVGEVTTESPSEQITRWHDAICPQTIGLTAPLGAMVTARVREIAAEVGAPVKADESCEPNLTVVFTSDPQGLLDKVRATVPEALGFHYLAQRKKISRVTHPIQAWYATATEDVKGRVVLDTDDFPGMNMDEARAVTGGRLSMGWRSRLVNALIVVDAKAIQGMQIGPLADYVAMMALSQTEPARTCKALDSIANLMSPDCPAERKPTMITDTDLAYLKGVYWMSPTAFASGQRGQIAFRMKQVLDGR